MNERIKNITKYSSMFSLIPAKNPLNMHAMYGVLSFGKTFEKTLKIRPSFAIEYIILGRGNIDAYKLF